jgi:hypothetical protein
MREIMITQCANRVMHALVATVLQRVKVKVKVIPVLN